MLHAAVSRLTHPPNFSVELKGKQKHGFLYFLPYNADQHDGHLQVLNITMAEGDPCPLQVLPMENQPLLATLENTQEIWDELQLRYPTKRSHSQVGTPFSLSSIFGAVIARSYGDTV